MLYLAGPRVLPVVICLVLPLILNVYWQKVLLSVACFAILAISWDILAQTGMISLGQSLFFGIGAYCAGIMNHYMGIPPPSDHSAGGCFWRSDRHPVSAAGSASSGSVFFHGHPDYPPDAGPGD